MRGTTRLVGLLATVALSSTLSGGLALSSERRLGIWPDLAFVLGDAGRVEAALAADLDFRSQLHLNSDPEYVRSLYERPELTTGNRLYGALFTAAEAADVTARFDLSGDVAAIWDAYGESESRAGQFAGMLIDHAAGGKLVVYTTALLDAYSNLEWVTGLSHPERLELRHAAVSFEELDGLRLRIQGAMQAGDPDVDDATGLRIDVASNAVVVYIDPGSLARTGPEARRRTLVERFPGAPLIVEPKASEPGAGAAEYIGGRAWGYSANQGWCTSAFKVRRTGADPDYMLTAGHCMNGDPSLETQETIYRSDSLIGRRTDLWAFRDGGVVDVGLIREKNDEGYTGDFKPYVRHNSYRLPVRGTSSYYTANDELRCVTGRKTGTDCGTISDSVFHVHYENFRPVVELYDLVKFRTQTTCGDSGGSVYAYVGGYAYANGIYNGGGPRDSCPPAGSTFDWSFYSKWRNIPESWDVVLSIVPPDVDPCPPTCILDDPDDDS